MIIYIPDYEVIRNADMCIACRVCEQQCANEVHKYDADLKKMVSNTASCVDCQRCVCLCPTHALKVIKSDNTFKINANWTNEAISDIIRQAGTERFCFQLWEPQKSIRFIGIKY